MSDVRAVRRWLEARTHEMLADVAALVRTESPSDDKAANDGLLAPIEAMLLDAGARLTDRVTSAAHGDVLIAEFAGREGRPALLLCHRDTVFPVGTVDERPFTVRGGQAFGPGVFDMKAGIVIGVWAQKALHALGLEPARPVRLLLNADEEIGSPSSKTQIQSEARRAGYVLVLEPAKDGNVKTRRKGWGRYHLRVEGRAAHAGADPELGVSAVHEVARQISEIAALADATTGTTVNVGTVRGGIGANVVAASAEADIDCRFWTGAEATRLDQAIMSRRAHDVRAHIVVDGGVNRLPLERTEDVARLFDAARRVAAAIDLRLDETSTGGVSDGNLAAEAGATTLDGLGAVGAGAHGVDEYVEIASLPERAALVAGLLLSV